MKKIDENQYIAQILMLNILVERKFTKGIISTVSIHPYNYTKCISLKYTHVACIKILYSLNYRSFFFYHIHTDQISHVDKLIILLNKYKKLSQFDQIL